jgi:hypothetical protein
MNSMPRPRWAATACALALALAFWGCGGNVTSGGFGEVEVQVSSDAVAEAVETGMMAAAVSAAMPARATPGDRPAGPSSPGAASSASPGAAGSGSPGASALPAMAVLPPMAGLAGDGSGLQGTLTVTVRSFVREGRARWVEITDGPQEVVLPLDDPTPVVVARASLPEGEYEAVRTVFGRIRVQVTGGLLVGGAPFTGELQIPVAGGGLLVAEERLLRVERRSPLALLLELRAPRWLPLVDRESRTVPEVDFRREFRVRTPGR